MLTITAQAITIDQAASLLESHQVVRQEKLHGSLAQWLSTPGGQKVLVQTGEGALLFAPAPMH